MPLDRPMTADESDQLDEDLHKMSILFRNTRLSDGQLEELVDDLIHYHGFTYSFAKLREAIRLTRQRFSDPGEVLPKPKFIMDRINPKA